MKLLKLAVILSTFAWISGCSVYTPFGDVVVPGGVYHGDHGDHDDEGHGGGFCPPGQAKKGNC